MLSFNLSTGVDARIVIHPPGSDGSGEPLAIIFADGRVECAGSVDVAAKAFWLALSKMIPTHPTRIAALEQALQPFAALANERDGLGRLIYPEGVSDTRLAYVRPTDLHRARQLLA